MYGLEKQDWETIRDILKRTKTTRAILFGSRAKGTYRPGSDVDLAIDGDEREASYLLNEETPLPYSFDVINLEKLSSESLRKHIERVGIKIL